MSDKELLRYINLFRDKAEQGKLVIFVGAGISCNVDGMPDWNGLIQNMANAIGYSKCSTCRHKTKTCESDCSFRNDFSADEFLKIPQYVFNQDENLYRKIWEESIPDKAIDAPLSSAIFDINPAHIITTNYDHLLESSTNEFCEQYEVIKQDRDLLVAKKGKYIIKMHGDSSDYNSIVLKEQDYLNYSQKHVLIELFIKSLLTDHVVLFLGYSLNDYNIKLIISWLNYMRGQNNALGSMQKVGYIILDQSQVDGTQQNYFAGNNIEVININKMPLINKIPDSLKLDQGKRLYSFLCTIADASLEESLMSITDEVRVMSGYTFVEYEKILQHLYIKNYEVIGWQLRLHSENDYLRLTKFLDQNIPEATQLKQLFVNTGILYLESVHAHTSVAIDAFSENMLLKSETFNLYIQNQYNELGILLEENSSDIDTVENYFYKSIINGYSYALENYNTINFSALSLDQKVAYLHNQAVLQTLLTYSFSSKRIEHFIQNIASSKEREMFSTYLDIFDGSSRKRLEMQSALSELKEDTLSRTTIHLGNTSIAKLYKIKPLAMTQYFFYFFNHLFFEGFKNLPIFLQPYIEAIICANSEYAEVPIQWCGEFIENEKHPISYIDIDIITKFSSTRDLYKLLDEYHIKHLRIDADIISFLVACFENLCTSIVTTQTYGYKFSSITTLANLAILLNLVELDAEHAENLRNALTKLFYNGQVTQILFSIRCPDYRNVLRSLSTLFRSLPHGTDTEVIRKIVTTHGFLSMQLMYLLVNLGL